MFLIVITACNVRRYLDLPVASLATQTDRHWRAVFVDDCSRDGTSERFAELVLEHAFGHRCALIRNVKRQYKGRNVYQVLKEHGDPEDIVVMLDGDDWLASDTALAVLRREYRAGWDVVWSNWRGSDGSRGTSDYLNPFLSPRAQPWVTSHLFTFRKRLFDAVTEADLKDDGGRWFKAGCDLALGLPILDQTIKCRHIEDVLYVYNRDNSLNADKRGVRVSPYVIAAQVRTAAVLGRRQPKQRTAAWKRRMSRRPAPRGLAEPMRRAFRDRSAASTQRTYRGVGGRVCRITGRSRARTSSSSPDTPTAGSRRSTRRDRPVRDSRRQTDHQERAPCRFEIVPKVE